MAPHQAQVERLTTIPGVDRFTAWTLIAEFGVDMSVFADADHAASWAGLTPGNCESAGKRNNTRTRKGNRWVKRALCQSAWAASRKKNCYLAAFFYRKATRRGMKKAAIATAHRMVVIAYHLLRDGGTYQEKGGDFFDRSNPLRTTRRLSRRLERLGYEVILKPHVPLPAPSPAPKRGRGRPRQGSNGEVADLQPVT